jgi:MbtH protein
MQSEDSEESSTMYRVLLNDEEQYSLWRADKAVPQGWTAVGNEATKQECLAYIESVWTDMRPLSLRRRMEADAASGNSKPN